MKRIFIGHRGVGKTSLLNRHSQYFKEVPHFDLDSEIEKSSGEKIPDLFFKKGEAFFRELEKMVFNDLTKEKSDFVIAVGGGFNPLEIPTDFEVIYVSRETDENGRIFLNRPLINSQLSFLQDSKELYKKRQPFFLKRADFIYHMPEGLNQTNEIEKTLFDLNYSGDAYFTATDLKELSLNIKSIELRTDFFIKSEIEKIIKNNPHKKYLVSYRSNPEEFIILDHQNIQYDWALELGPIPQGLSQKINVVSIHEGSLGDCIQSLNSYSDYHLKLCPIIKNWEELIRGYEWQKADPLNRSFLPRSEYNRGDWNWFRVLMQPQQKINFVRGRTDNLDQPTFFQNLLLNTKSIRNWMAVLGSPIKHSWSPVTHQDFFTEIFLKVLINKTDFQNAFSFLQKMGLKFAAVTSPLKFEASQICHQNFECNSLKWTGTQWLGTSTDDLGFEKLMKQIPKDKLDNTVLWGGDGVISSLQKIQPDLICYSAQSGKIKINPKNRSVDPRVVIWAAPRREGILFPIDWKPEIVIDLNYTSDSMGLEYASKIKCKYISGADMFFEQAHYQRQFWKDEI